MKLGVALGWHTLAWEDLAALVETAEARGFDAAYVDGDITQLGVRHDRDALDGWTVTTALLARTTRIGIGSIRLVQHWNAAHLAQVAASAERIAPGRLQLFVSTGDRPEDPAWGYRPLSHRERCEWLDETLHAVRALLAGETVTRSGDFVTLAGARVRPTPPPGALAIEVAGRSPRLLGVVARHAAIWNVNWPPVAGRVETAADALAKACAEIGRDPTEIRRRMWIFTRIGRMTRDDALAEFRRWNPWFAALSDAELAPALVVGSAESCADQLAEHARALGLEMPVLDLSGLDAGAAREVLETFPVGRIR